MSNPSFNTILEEYSQLKEKGQDKLDRYFTHHSESKITEVAVNLTAERDELSKMYKDRTEDHNETQLNTLVPRVITEFKLKWVKSQIKEQMNILQTETDEERLNEATLNYKELNDIKSGLSKLLGNRVF
jgi:hypothetical protein